LCTFLSGSIPQEIGNLTELTWLFLSGNQLSGSIPPEIGNLTQLDSLELTGNQLSGSIPPEIGNLTQLDTELSLSKNQLSGSIPPEIGNLTLLMGLYLDENQLSGSIPPEIGNLTLLWLELDKNQLTGDIPSSLSNLTNTIFSPEEDGEIDLAYNCLTASDAELINFLKLADPDWAETQTACESNNTAPILNPIGNQSIEQSKTLSFTVTATNADNNALIFTLRAPSENATINPNTGVFSWTPEQAGTFTLSVTVTETDGTPSNLSDEGTFTITVTEPPPPATCQNSATANEFNQTLPGVDGEFNNIWWGELGMEAFAVGNRGRIVHLEMLNLVEMNSGTNNNLFGIWGNSSNDLFAVGDNGTIIHYNGTNWTTQQSNSGEHLYGIWGNSATDVFATGLNGAILHYDGSQWNVMQSNTSQDLFGIWGSSATDVFAIGSQGTIIHYDGNQWAKMVSGTTNDLFGILGISSNDIYAVTKDYSTVVHYDGSEWAEMDSGFSTGIFSIFGNQSDMLGLGLSDTISPSSDNTGCTDSEAKEDEETIIVTEPPPPATCQNSAIANEFNQTLPDADDENGMTWGKRSHDDVLGVDYVNCNGCNAYSGETSCSSKLPILCLKKENLPDPGVYVPDKSPGVMYPRYYYGWTGGRIELTSPVSGDALKGISDANDICEFQFGPGYKIAEHHDGNGGWGWYAYGNIDDGSRFWVSINDQSSNCWGYGTGVSSARTDAQMSELLNCGGSATTPEPTIPEPTTIDSEANDESEKTITEPKPIIVDDDHATPTTVTQNLTITIEGNGKVTSTPDGIDCGVDCSEDYTNGTAVTVTAVPEKGSRFTSWGGKCSGIDTDSFTVTMNTAMNCSAIFAPLPSYTLTIKKVGSGAGTVTTSQGTGISCGTVCTESYYEGSTIILIATPDDNSKFVQWAENGCGGSITMTKDLECKAVFNQLPPPASKPDLPPPASEPDLPPDYTLKVITMGSGKGTVQSEPSGIDCGTDCEEDYASNTIVTITATLEVGTRFSSWQGDCQGTELSTTATMTANLQCQALFKSIPNRTLTVNQEGSGTGMVSASEGLNSGITNCTSTCSEDYSDESTIALTAIADSDSLFTGWSGDENCADSITTITADRNCTATFELLPPPDDLEDEPTNRYKKETTIVTFEDKTVELPVLDEAETVAVNTEGEVIETDAGFVGGISVEGSAFAEEAQPKSSDVLDVRSSIEVDSEHLGQPAEVLVVAAYQPDAPNTRSSKPAPVSFYMLVDTKGTVVPWDMNMASLIPLKTVATLDEAVEVPIYQGALGITGTVNLYVGYRANDGTVIYSPDTLDINITE